MAETFECPKCGAPLNLKPEDLAGKDTVSCPYCGESVIVPESMRQSAAQRVLTENDTASIRELTRQAMDMANQASYNTAPPAFPQIEQKPRRSMAGCLITGAIVAAVVAIVGAVIFLNVSKSFLQRASNVVVVQPTNPAAAILTQVATQLDANGQATVIAKALDAIPTEASSPTAAVTPTPAIDTTATAQVESTRTAQNALLLQQQNWPVLLQEKFANDQRNWTVGQDNSNLAIEDSTISGNKYTWKVTTKKSMGSFTFPDMPDQTDMFVSVDMQMTTSSNNSEDQSGIVFRRSSKDSSFYFFSVNPSGTYSLSMYDGSQWSDMISTTQTSLLKAGQVNHLAVSVQGDQILLVINNTIVDSYEDSQLSSGSAGLGLNLPSPGEDATVIFTNFYVRAPQK